MKLLSSSTAIIPLKAAVLGSLSMAWAWGVIAGSVGLNALIKSNQEKSRLKKSVPAPAVLTIDTDDVFQSGVVLTVVGALIAVLCSIFILMLFFTRGYAARSLRTQSLILAFCATWLLATLIPFTFFFATRSAKVSASIGGVELPASIIKQTEKALGSTSVYREIGYLRLVAILPWITILFTVIASGVLFTAGSPARRAHAHAQASPADSTTAHETRTDDGLTEEKGDKSTTPTAAAA
ncbi:hypothetical protein D9615_010452 [Tricholomella constricta]|uniref:Uncharacterized protein n=1 Tax=Tricholomella constricta TaxID=117010 RepID=A0A8H5GM58_9AGAR|nr:hypothetical protein D9615_010452 [Tricholomella constricta]